MPQNDGTVKIGIDFEVDKKGLSNIDKDVSNALKGASANVESLKGSLGRIGNVAKTTLTGLGSFASSIASMTVKSVTVASTAVSGLLTYGANYNAQLEQYRTSFEVMTGSAEKAVEISERLVQIGASTPFETSDLAEVTQLLMNYGLSADEAIDSMMMLGDISQGSADKMNRIAMAYGQMSSAGKVSLEDIKQMIEAGFNPLQEISESTGESMASLYQRISDGEIAVEEITAAMERSTSVGGKYFQSMEKQSKTASGQISTLKDNFAQLAGVIAGDTSSSLTAEILPMLNDMLSEMQAAFEKNGFEGLAVAFSESLSEIIVMGAQKIPDFMDLGGNVIQAIADGLKNNSGEISGALLTVLLALPEFIIDNAATLLDVGSVFVEELTNGIVDNSDEISESAIRFVNLLVDFIVLNAPLIARAAKELIISLADAIGKEIPALKPFTDLIQTLVENLKPLAEFIIPVVAGIEGFKAVQSVVGIVTNLAGGIKSLASGTGLLSGALTILGGPATAAIAGLGGLLGLMAGESIKSAIHTAELDAQFRKATEGSRELAEGISAQSEKMADLKKEADAQIEADKVMIDQTQRLYSELKTLVDENGVVKQGYEDRVAYITSELETATGLEIELIDGQIQKYGELKENIEEVIKKKRAESMESAYSGVYQEALQQLSTSSQDYLEASKTADASQYEINRLYEKAQNAARAEGRYIAREDFTYENKGALSYYINQADIESLRAAEENLKNSKTAMTEIKQQVAQNQADVQAYEKATEAMYTGNYSLAQAYFSQIGDLSYANLVDSEATLDEQVKAVDDAVDNAIKLYKAGIESGNNNAITEFESTMAIIIEQAKSSGIDAGTLLTSGILDELLKLKDVDTSVILDFAKNLGIQWGDLFGMYSSQTARQSLLNNLISASDGLLTTTGVGGSYIASGVSTAITNITNTITNNISNSKSTTKQAEDLTKEQTKVSSGKGQ